MPAPKSRYGDKSIAWVGLFALIAMLALQALSINATKTIDVASKESIPELAR